LAKFPQHVAQQDLNMHSTQLHLMEDNCIFCQIINGIVPSKKVYEDEQVIAVLDINPASPGHLLLLPKKHYSVMPQIPEDELGHLFSITQRLSHDLLNKLKAAGTNIFIANGQVAGQKAPHFMIHIIPRTENDGIDLSMKTNELARQDVASLKHALGPKVKELFGLSDDIMEKLGYQPGTQEKQEPIAEAEPESITEQESTPEPSKGEKVKPLDDDVDIDAISRLFK